MPEHKRTNYDRYHEQDMQDEFVRLAGGRGRAERLTHMFQNHQYIGNDFEKAALEAGYSERAIRLLRGCKMPKADLGDVYVNEIKQYGRRVK